MEIIPEAEATTTTTAAATFETTIVYKMQTFIYFVTRVKCCYILYIDSNYVRASVCVSYNVYVCFFATQLSPSVLQNNIEYL